MSFIKNKLLYNPLTYIVLAGLILRFCFWIFAANSVLGSAVYINGDTSGWTDSFLNLIKYGHYTFEMGNKEAYFGRVPGFSFFWGLHYLLFGPAYVYKAVAFSQIILDTFAIFFIHSISLKIFNDRKAALFSSFLYSTYPFIIIWTTVSYSEVLSNFLNILCIYVVLRERKETYHYLLIGILCACIFLTREFVAITLLFVCVYLIINKDVPFRITSLAWVITAFFGLYSLWPIRNYINHNRIILTRSNDGFIYYNKDYQAFRTWVVCWDNDEAFWLQKTVNENYAPHLSALAFNGAKDSALVVKTLRQCGICGSSFRNWEKTYHVSNKTRDIEANCNEEISKNFSLLRSNFIRDKTFTYFTVVPIENLKKAFFKNRTLEKDSLITKILFGYRSLLVLAGFAGILYSIRNSKMILISGYILFIYVFFSWVIRYIEMRNLIQADTLMLIPAGWLLVLLLNYLKKRFYSV
jgi:hypothetical protein